MNSTASAPLLRAGNLRKHFGSGTGLVSTVNGVDLDLCRGTTVAIMGPSGCGKSTLLHMLGGLERPSSGQLARALGATPWQVSAGLTASQLLSALAGFCRSQTRETAVS
jgi:ABC-type glutathione transport system ATPase component